MCDYCDCRSLPAIQSLSDQHERILEIVDALRRGGGSDADIASRLDELEAQLTPHTAQEEIGIFARLRAAGTAEEYVARFEHDHRTIEHLLDTARADHREVTALIDELSRHVLEEETDMYPAARQVLSPTDWDEVDRAVDHGVPRAVAGTA